MAVDEGSHSVASHIKWCLLLAEAELKGVKREREK